MTSRGAGTSEIRLALSPGSHLGPYEIIRLLGAGGMGEVYRARDPRLRRDVAVKVLHPRLAFAPEHVDRLAREARAAGSLNHPNIVAVFDVGLEGSVPYIVTELLEGELLRDRLARGVLPYKKAIDYAVQMAAALGAAHEKGIWHRDVKPSNAFITGDGRVKLLDFGLVKLKTVREPVALNDSTDDDETEPGGVLGTLGYMSPEQLLGEPVDHRTDLFALGAVLYEMLSGAPAFLRSSRVETTRAVLNEEPADLLQLNTGVPLAATAVVQRCLEKNREERFQSARDLAFALRQLLEARPAPPPSPWVKRLGAVLLLLGAVGAGAVVIERFSSRTAPRFEQLTFRRARIGGARFDQGRGVVFSEAREGKAPDVWWLSGPESPATRLLGRQGADLLTLRGSKVALSLGRRFVVGERFAGTLAEAPLGEGSPRELLDDAEDADFDPSGQQLAVVHSPSVGGESRLEYPPGVVLHKTKGSIRFPRFAPDGRRIAFLEDPTARGSGGSVMVVEREGGRVTVLTEKWSSARGLAWSPRGDEIWFAAGGWRMNRALRAVDLRGRQRLILEAPASLTLWDVAPDGRTLITRDEERITLVGTPPGESTERDLSWFDASALADVSQDGKTLLFADRLGVYISRTDGSPPTFLGLRDGFGDGISPDGKRVLATNAAGDQLVLMPAGPGDATRVHVEGCDRYRGAMWLPDGLRILVNCVQADSNLRSYVHDLQGGGPPRALTRENVWGVSVSADGLWVAAIASAGEGISIWPVAGGPSRDVPFSRPGERPEAWSNDGRFLWVFRRGEVPAEVWRVDVSSGQRHLWKKLAPPDPSGVYTITEFRITRDGRAYFYTYKRQVSQLYVATGLR